MRKSLLVLAILSLISGLYIYAVVGWPSRESDAGFVIRCFKDRYHSFRIDESFINPIDHKGREKHPGFGYKPSEPLADVFLRVACRQGLPAEIPDQEALLTKIRIDMENFRIPPTYFERDPNYDIFYYPGELDLIPNGLQFMQIIFVLFLDGLIYFCFKE